MSTNNNCILDKQTIYDARRIVMYEWRAQVQYIYFILQLSSIHNQIGINGL